MSEQGHGDVPEGREESSMEFLKPVMVYDGPSAGGVASDRICTVICEAPGLAALARMVGQWVASHRHYDVLSFSHSVDTRWEGRTGLRGPRAVTVYTGFLLVRAPAEDHAPSEIDDLLRDILSPVG